MFLGVTLIVWARLAAVPLSPYGSNGAAYIEHGTRVNAAVTVTRWVTRADWPDGETLIGALDDSFPPLLHVLALPLTWVFDGRVGPVVAFGVVWLLLIGLAAGRIASLVTGRIVPGVLVAAGVFAVPGLHASAARYYFDLPMSCLLWVSTAVLMSGWHERPGRAGVLGGLLGLAACLTKWTALPYLALMVAGAALTRQVAIPSESGPTEASWDLRARAHALGAYLGTLLLGIGGYLYAAGPDNSLIFTVRESALGSSHDGEGGGIADAVLGMVPTLLRADPERRFRLIEHTEGLAFAVFSPLLLLAALALTGVWLARSRRGWPLVLFTAVGQLVFLVVWIRPVDERFLLALAPALVLSAGIGLASLPKQPRVVIGAALAGFALLVAFDFHHMPKTRLSTLWTEAAMWGPRYAPYPPPPRPRGISASTSAQGRGWVRRDEAQEHRTALREALVARIEGCQAEMFAAVDGKPFITIDGSHDWLGFETQRRHLWEPSAQPPTIYPLNWDPDPNYSPQPGSFEGPAIHGCSPDDEIPLKTLVFSDAPRDAPLTPPACPVSARWRHLDTVQDPDGGSGVALWSPFGVDPCRP